MERLRRTILYIPGNNPAMINNGGIFGADVICFDLEDSVAVREKAAARCLVAAALRRRELVNPMQREIMVRINGFDTPFATADLEAIVRVRPDSIRVPKVEDPATVLNTAKLLDELEKKEGLDYRIEISPILETVLGVSRAVEIARCHERVTALSFGAEDFTRDLGTSRTKDGFELVHARGLLVMAAKAAGIQAIDTVFPDVGDYGGLESETSKVRQLGFDGKSVINPRQIEIVHRIFRPSDEEIRQALSIEKALEDAERKGLGVASLNGKMVDTPVAKKAGRVLALARRLGLVEGGGEQHVA